MIEAINSYLCHDCGSDHAISEVVYGKIKINLCKECIKRKNDKKEFKFSELSDKAKAYAIYIYLFDQIEIEFDDAWGFYMDNESTLRFNSDGEELDE